MRVLNGFDTLTQPRATIEVRDLTLDYPLGPLVRSSVKSAIFSLFNRQKEIAPTEYVRALDGVSFEVNPGERVGVIGRNGSGKSTLLRALAGVYPGSGGSVTVRGRIQGMFDIGLGFEPEATGRENILYRGLVMGLSPSEIKRRAKDIVEFAELGMFVDVPVRAYSTGMMVRLAFAISTYLDGDVLLIDEILSAGDAAFQEKARLRMAELVRTAAIVMLVSHDLDSIRSVCTRCLWLGDGRILADGPVDQVCETYLAETVHVA